MSAVLSASSPPRAAARQNWILGPAQDTLFIVAAPPLVLGAAIALFAALGAADATAYIMLLHVVLTVAHHLPTFIRVYGDVELFRRFRWTFILAPVIPFGFAAVALALLNARGLPVQNVLYLWVLLALWDPWHFLMQHYGFTRIYDRHNAAPKKLAARMDLLLCAVWFVSIMLASGEWLAGILEDLYLRAHLPAALLLPPAAVRALTGFMLSSATLATIAYGAYLVWCRRRGHFVSVTKLALLVTMFGVMFLAYTPNRWILTWAPGWTFAVGFAVIGIVHMTQYLAIVWRYNSSLASRPEAARAGLFRRLHARGGWLVGAGYVALCLAYGAVLTRQHENRWLMSVLLTLGFTSTLLHYYFDGFIWKLRQSRNREHLGLARQGDAPEIGAGAASAATRPRSPFATLLRHALYFGVPLSILSGGALWVLDGPGSNYVGHMLRGGALYGRGRADEALDEARTALASMEWQLPLARHLVELEPRPAREAALAFLIYNRSRYAELLIPSLAAAKVDASALARHRDDVAQAASLLAHALEDGGPIGTVGGRELRREDAYATLASWREETER
ncbi:MAG TPA: hypothetical protein VMU03_09445 [Gammaproteobacteria bacterium]|nr:hypothetical protein [Gammaproteobacteria bacterium]